MPKYSVDINARNFVIPKYCMRCMKPTDNTIDYSVSHSTTIRNTVKRSTTYTHTTTAPMPVCLDCLGKTEEVGQEKKTSGLQSFLNVLGLGKVDYDPWVVITGEPPFHYNLTFRNKEYAKIFAKANGKTMIKNEDTKQYELLN